MDLADCQNQFHHIKFMSEYDFCDWFILLIIHIHLGNCQPLGSLKIKTVASLCREMWAITPTSLFKKNLTYSSIFKVDFMKSFAAAKAFLVFVKNRCRSSRSQMFFKIGVLKIFAMYTGKNLCWSLFSIKFRTFTYFLVNIAKLLRAAFL